MNIKHKRSYLLLMPALGLSVALTANAADTATPMGNRTRDNAPAVTAPSPHGGAHAATDTSRNDRHAGTDAAATRIASVNDIRASKLIGERIVNDRNERLGKVKDLIVDTTNGKVQYAVVSFGGFLGMGDKLFAYPLQSFQPARDGDHLVLNVDKEKLKAAPGFDDKNWPDFNKGDYRARVDTFHGTDKNSGTQVTAPDVRFARASQMLKADIKDSINKDIGDVKDMVVNMQDGRVHYVVVKFDRAWNPVDKLVALPIRAFKAEGRNDKDLVYVASREELQRAPSFDTNHWPDVNRDDRFRADVDRYDQTWNNRGGNGRTVTR